MMLLRGVKVGDRASACARARRWRAVAAALAVCGSLAVQAAPLPKHGAAPAPAPGQGSEQGMGRGAAEPIRIPLEAMGYQTIAPEFLLAGSSMLTVHFVDREHLLVTFNVRRLMRRDADPEPDDDDRTVGASLVELPTGKVLARTEWRVRDRLQYLWDLGHGRFLLRVRNRLAVIAPMANEAEDAFRETPLLESDRHIVAVLVSANDDLLTVETMRQATGPAQATGVSLANEPAPVEIDFYRMASESGGAEQVSAIPAGSIRMRAAVALSLTTAGFLEVVQGSNDAWEFNFDELGGKVDELAEFDTSCPPRTTFVGRGEFVAFGCRGSADKTDLAGFNLKGEAMWQQSFYDQQVAPTFAFAPEAGRFALGRTLVSTAMEDDMALQAGEVTGQEVRVYQSHDGRLLLRVNCSPVERAGQNFALSADGMRLAVVQETVAHHAATADYDAYTQNEAAVNVYTLPPLTEADRVAVKTAQTMVPADTGMRIDEALERISAAEAKGQTQAGEAAAGLLRSAGEDAGSAAGGGASSTTGTEAPATEGDVEPTGPRKPPTLYGPGEGPSKKPPE